mgnify:CR=1 FL=1|jgi:hypothetical protein
MWLRLRQIALVAEKLAPIETQLEQVLGIKVCYRDPGVGHFGLENALFPIGNQLLEVVAPTQENTAGGRYLERRGGDGGYMVITQCDDHAPRRRRVEELGIRRVAESDSEDYGLMQLHPKDTGGSFFEIDEQRGQGALDADGPWEPAGPDWQTARCLDRIVHIRAAEIQCDDPEVVAARWSTIAQIPLQRSDGMLTLPLDNAVLRFVSCEDGRPEGLGGIDVEAADKEAILASASQLGLPCSGSMVSICGLRITLV